MTLVTPPSRQFFFEDVKPWIFENTMSNAEHDRRIDYVEFSVHSVPDAKRFYGSAFGWTFDDYGPDYASFADGRLSGGFQTAKEVRTGGPLVVIYAADLEAMERRVKQSGGKIVRPIFSFPGGRRFHFNDPSGNELAVWSDNEK
jgi:predicted enzyme related to lactoylglutathione lyase